MRRSSHQLVEPGLKRPALAWPPRGASSRRAALRASASTAALVLLMGAAQAQTIIDGGSTVTVPDATHPSPWSMSGDLYVGNTGTGALTIHSGGRVDSGRSYLGHDPGASGTVTVTGSGSSWSASGYAYIGYAGTGSLMIGNGGSARAYRVDLGIGGGSGTVRVSGANSRFRQEFRKGPAADRRIHPVQVLLHALSDHLQAFT